MKKKLIVTTSWDDGHKLDIKLAKLLKKYGIKGTFYVSPKNHELDKNKRLTNAEIKTLSKDFEIGAHSMTHPHLTKIATNIAYNEIKESKEYLERIIGKKVLSFCYPYGDFNNKVASLVEQNGFSLARTTKRYNFGKSKDSFALPTSFHTYNHFTDAHKIVGFAGLNIKNLFKYINWENLAIDLFEEANKNGTVFHLWGHSWEIEKFNAWDKLENVLQHIAQKSNVSYITNGEL